MEVRLEEYFRDYLHPLDNNRTVGLLTLPDRKQPPPLLFPHYSTEDRCVRLIFLVRHLLDRCIENNTLIDLD